VRGDVNPFVAKLQALPPPPKDRGTVTLIVLRPDRGDRLTPTQTRAVINGGLEGDRWARRSALLPGRYANRDITAINTDVARTLVGDQPPELTGDNLHLDLDLSVGNLPVGTHLRVGEALLVVSPKPHMGCNKFAKRFGRDAQRVNGDPALKGRRIRGVMLVVVEGGAVRVSDAVEVIRAV